MSAEAKSLREEIEAAARGDEVETEVESVETETEVEAHAEQETQTERARDERGRFTKSDNSEPVSEAEPEQTVEAEVEVEAKPAEAASEVEQDQQQIEPALSPPNGWSAEAKGKWATLDEDVQRAVIQREQDVHKQITKHDDERNFGREMGRVIQPYVAQIQAEGGTPSRAVQELLNTAYILRTGSPEQKKMLLLRTAQQFGVDLSQPQAGKDDGQVPSYVGQLQQEIYNLRQSLTDREQQQTQALQAEVDSEIEAFAVDPAHPYFETVKDHMAALLSGNVAKDLQDAYDQACHARPDIRATLEATQRATEEQKRRADAKRKADEARRKTNASLTGSPGQTNGAATAEGRSLREEIEANFAASEGAAV